MFNILFKTAINNVYNETHMKPEDINSVTLKILLKGYLIPKEFILKKYNFIYEVLLITMNKYYWMCWINVKFN